MGRVRGKWIKNLSKKLVEKFPDKFNNKFEDNKKFLEKLKIIDDKPVRNRIAGYIVDVVNKKRIK